MVEEIIRNIFQPEIAPVIFLVKTHKCGSRLSHLTIFLVCFLQNQSDQYVNDYGNNQRYSPAIYTHCYDTSGTRLFAAGGPLQIGLKGNYLSLFQWRNLELHYMSFLFSQKNIAKQRQKIVLTRQPSTLTATTPVVPNWWTPTNWTLRKLFVYFSDGTWNWIIRLFCSFSKT